MQLKLRTATVCLFLGAAPALAQGKYRITAESSEVNTTSSSVRDVVSGQKLLALPVAGRSSYDLIARQPGVIQGAGANGGYNMNGNRGGSVNFTTDGINSQDNLPTQCVAPEPNGSAFGRPREKQDFL